jgi:hypothetical protein
VLRVVGELIRFPVERRQQQPCVSLLRQAKVVELEPRRSQHVREFAGVSVDLATGSWMPYQVNAQGFFSFGELQITGTDAKPNGAHPGTG